MIIEVTRSELGQLLADWQAGHVAAASVHEWAVARYAVTGVNAEDEVVNEVLDLLDALDVNLITAAEVPALQRLLQSPASALDSALEAYDSDIALVDYESRRRDLANDPLYAPFCGQPSSR